jgi:predicted transposase/invertase (TIGR01784 family)
VNGLTKEDILKEAGVKLGINTTGELLDPRFDYVFKRIFTAQEEQSKIALIDFLNNVLTGKTENIVDLTVISNELPIESHRQKKSRFDILVVFENGEKANVEMEFRPKDDFIKRSLHNVSRMIYTQPLNRQDYRKLKRCYMVGIMGYNLFSSEYGYINTFTFRDDRGRELSGDMQITYIELEKTDEFLNKPVEELTGAECWGLFLRCASYDDKHEVLEKISRKQRGIKMAVDVLNILARAT